MVNDSLYSNIPDQMSKKKQLTQMTKHLKAAKKTLDVELHCAHGTHDLIKQEIKLNQSKQQSIFNQINELNNALKEVKERYTLKAQHYAIEG